jgi:hypothetical protein
MENLRELLLAHAVVIVVIIALTQILKGIFIQFGLDAKMQRFYVFIPLGFGLLLAWPVSLILGLSAWYYIVVGAFMDAAISSYLWKAGKDTEILGWVKRLVGLG